MQVTWDDDPPSDLHTELLLAQSWSAAPSVPAVAAPAEGTHPLCQFETFMVAAAARRNAGELTFPLDATGGSQCGSGCCQRSARAVRSAGKIPPSSASHTPGFSLMLQSVTVTEVG